MIRVFAGALMLVIISAADATHAQVTVDISKITCEQFNVQPKADSVATWLSGYYHGDHHDPVMDISKFEANAKDLRAACLQAENFKRPIMQLIEAGRKK